MSQIKDAELVGIADLSMETAEAAAKDFGGEAFDNAETMLDTVKPDAVFVCISPAAHGSIENMLIDRNIPFLVEKPVTKNFSEIKSLKKISNIGKNLIRENLEKLNKLSKEDLQDKLGELQKQLEELKMTHAISPLENPLQIRSARRVIARLKTALSNQEA